eukprot:3672097-Pyramimonas_sp.AAC.1
MKLFVDDLSIQVRGAWQCLTVLQAAVTFYIREIEGTWRIPVSRGARGKGCILVAAASARNRCAAWAKDLGLAITNTSSQLGVDSAGGAVVRKRKKMQKRFKYACQR